MGKPSYDDETLAAYFQPLDPIWFDDPVVGPTLRRLAVEDPDIIGAVADIDRSQIRDALERTHAERLRLASSFWNSIQRLRGS